MASFAEVSKYGILPLDWHHANARFCVTCTKKLSRYRKGKHKKACLSFVLFQINLVAKNHERKILWIPRAGLNQELVSPAVQSLKRFGTVDVINESTAVSATIECNAEGLKSFLPGGIP